MRLLLGSKCSYTGIQGFRIVALMAGNDFVIALTGVKRLDLFSNQLADLFTIGGTWFKNTLQSSSDTGMNEG